MENTGVLSVLISEKLSLGVHNILEYIRVVTNNNSTLHWHQKSSKNDKAKVFSHQSIGTRYRINNNILSSSFCSSALSRFKRIYHNNNIRFLTIGRKKQQSSRNFTKRFFRHEECRRDYSFYPATFTVHNNKNIPFTRQKNIHHNISNYYCRHHFGIYSFPKYKDKVVITTKKEKSL